MTWRRILIAVGVLAVLAGAGLFYVVNHDPGNVSNPDVAFDEETPAPGETPGPGKKPKPDEPFVWLTYGYTADRKREVDVPASLVKPPFKKRWAYETDILLEFPPVISEKSLFLLRDDAVLVVLDKENGDLRWSERLGVLSASSPYLDLENERLFITILSRYEGGPGKVVSMSTARGEAGDILWQRDLPSRTESSPILADKTVYFGSEDGTVYALNSETGRPRWTFQAAGPVKSALALKNGKLYFGDYAGKVYAVNASDGSLAWEAKTQGARFGFASGRFYGNPVVAHGRVFIGNVDSYVYSFSAENGELAWRTKTNGYVYASPTVGSPGGGEPTVFIGSYDGTFYALDARSGAIRWSEYVGGHISGGSTLLGDTIWFADLDTTTSFVLDARNGERIWDYPRGGYATVVTDQKLLFLAGYNDLYAFEPLSEEQRKKIKAKKRRRTLRAISRRRKCVGVARRHRRHRIAFRRCVRRTNAIRTPLHVIRKRRAARRRKG
jgi:outer membrane protein assembly factor BamB